MRPVLLAGTGYFALVFAAGFVLGAVRVLLIAPTTGKMLAVALEAPVMLAIAWVVSARLVARCAVPALPAARLGMGAVGFGLLLAAERLLGAALGTWESPLDSPAGRLGLAAQVVFGLIPSVQLALGRR